ncbi:MAG: Cof-type HAD-IIB family hydrolase [Armatimonadota bacterium]|nr:Cof-type HAD-IIB family hydrolase [Armatimonadota bacterium]MCX7776863.1 Cof-type HAD-IIB family hydrolase [Armatimonadota bacterium]MDW8024451.1 Cof-type HAD-IIB family hydrolase [Armatimonadota bacterium]
MLRIRLIAIDVDGTLIGSSKVPTERVKTAIRMAVDAGCEVVPATGRSRYTTRYLMEELGLSGPVILFGGAVVLHWGSGEVWHRVLIPVELAKKVVSVMRRYGMGSVVMADGIESDCVVAEKVLPPPDGYIERNIARLKWVDDLTQVMPFEPATIAAIVSEDLALSCIKQLESEFGEALSVAMSYSVAYSGWVVEVHHSDGSKGKALKIIAERLAIPREQVMAIGDNLNDIDMLQYAGLSVAMANSVEEVKRIAHEIVPSADEDGVAYAIHKFVLR